MNVALATALREPVNAVEDEIVEEHSSENKFDQVIINYETHNMAKDRINWETMCIEDQRELLARGAVRFFKNEEEIPFHRALL